MEGDGGQLTRISVFAEYFPPHLGSDFRIFELAKQLSSKGHLISFVVTPPPRSLAGLGELGFRDMSYEKRKEEREGLAGNFLGLPKGIALGWHGKKILAIIPTLLVLLLQAVRAIIVNRPQVIVLAHPSFVCGLVGFLAARITRRKIVLDCPDLWASLVGETLGVEESRFGLRAVQFAERYLISVADQVVVASTPIEEFAQRAGAKHVTLVPNGVDESSFRNGHFPKLESNPRVMYVGRFERWAGIDTMIDSAPIVLKSFPRVEFLVVGDGSLRKELLAAIYDKGLASKVRMFGPIAHSDVPKLISTADVGVIPFKGRVAGDAALPVKLFEFMAVGVPIVASDTTGIRDVITNGLNGLLAKPGSEEELANGIIRLIANRRLAEEISQRALRDIHSKYSWSTLSPMFESVVQRCL